MKILALESSARAASVAIWEDGAPLARYFQSSGLTHSRTLLAMTEAILKNTELSLAEMDGIAAAKGPGSFTGIRIGLAAAKGLAWSSGKGLCGVSTLEAMAYMIRDDRYVICPVMDARRSQVYNALFSFSGSRPERITEDRAISLEELRSNAVQNDKPFFLLGDGAVLCYNDFVQHGIPCVLAPEHLRLQDAWGVAAASADMEFIDPGDVEPNYLRLSQAERERLARLARQQK